MGCSVIWFRRDLRLDDHAALAEGCRRGAVLPLFVLDPALLFHPETGAARVAFLLQSLRALDADLRRRGARLVVRHGDPVHELVHVVRACRADAVIAHTDNERLVGRRRDGAVNRRLAAEGMAIHWLEPAGAGADLLSYSAWQRQWQAAMQAPAAALPSRLQLPAAAATALPDQPIPSLEELGLPASRTPLPPAGSAAALERLETFCNGPASRSYFWELSYPAARVSSGLSPYLKFGVVSPRQVLQRLAGLAAQGGGRQRSALQLASRLRWGAAMHQRFRHLPQLEHHSLWSSFDEPGSTSLDGQGQEVYDAWRQGRTGFPIVDAAARCLAAEGGWLELNFRSRAIYASFLANLCGIDWRLGALHFMRQLLDGDCPIDHYQWAMQAGVTVAGSGGWTRIYHPGQVAVDRCDPQGLFIRRWLPELAELTNDQLGAPPPMAAYPRPILDYDTARRRRLETLQRQRLQILDVRQSMARLPRDADGASADLFPAALDLDSLEPRQWSALLSWFRPGRSSEAVATRGTGDRAPQREAPRRGKARRQAPGQLSFDLPGS
ncbi:MAG: FAD-binding domain-containing protein [Vulcanococcus sp.]